MTSTTDTAGHPDVAEISDLTEGLLPPSRTADVRRHLDICELCADVHASLEEIRGLLGTLPGPPRMPADVAGRIDAALAAEALLSATSPGATDSGEPVGAAHSVSGGHDSPRVSRETSTAADRPAGHARGSSTGPGRKDSRREKRRRTVVLGTAFTAAALGLGSVLLTSLMGGSSGPGAEGGQTTAADTFSAAQLEKQVTDLLGEGRSPGGGSRTPHSLGVERGVGTEKPKVLKQPTVPACVQNGIGRNDAALATKEGRYKGTHALLVVLPDASDSTRVTAYIVDATCVEHPSTSKAEVLLTDTYARP
ncbi:hypothetical protein [Streptomyces sp. HUAS ZL42]|uniref:hypothetical protein n=1 Tax=Streptomyces sp. HUAS ZL42 TaxID=3231715 RepID=UPI00345E1242